MKNNIIAKFEAIRHSVATIGGGQEDTGEITYTLIQLKGAISLDAGLSNTKPVRIGDEISESTLSRLIALQTYEITITN